MAAMERMKDQYDKATQNGKDTLRNLLQKRNDDLQRYTNAVKKMSVDKEKELMDPVIRKLNSHLDAWGRRNGYDLVLGTMTGGNILQANAELNVTSQVLKDLNETYKDLPSAGPVAKAGRVEAGVGTREANP
jgi:Skp family chaperone for outer membrane proteins